GEEPGTIQTQRKYTRPSPISINGGISFPATIINGTYPNFNSLFNYAKYGNYFPMTFVHYCGDGRQYYNCRVASFSFSVVAGDVLNISSDIYSKFFDSISSDVAILFDTYLDTPFKTSEKIITFDQVHLEILDSDSSTFTTDAIQGLELEINNNLTEIYTAKPTGVATVQTMGSENHDANLFPRDLRLGMQEISGTISIYIAQGVDFLTISTKRLKLKLTVSNFSTEINCVLQPKQINGIVGPVIISIPFVGVDKALGD
ncbi:MAG: phage tail tube protein, partial [bacterium]